MPYIANPAAIRNTRERMQKRAEKQKFTQDKYKDQCSICCEVGYTCPPTVKDNVDVAFQLIGLLSVVIGILWCIVRVMKKC